MTLRQLSAYFFLLWAFVIAVTVKSANVEEITVNRDDWFTPLRSAMELILVHGSHHLPLGHSVFRRFE